MPSKRISRTELIEALALYSADLANFDFTSFVGHFFKDEPEWKGQVNKTVRQVRTQADVERRQLLLQQSNLQLKNDRESLQGEILNLGQLLNASARQIASLRTENARLKALIETMPEILQPETAIVAANNFAFSLPGAEITVSAT